MKNTLIREILLKEDIEKIREEGKDKAIFPFPSFNGVNLIIVIIIAH